MNKKPSSHVFRRVAAKKGVTYRDAIRICARNGGRRSAERRRKQTDQDQPPLL